MTNNYRYYVMPLSDADDGDQVFVPNCLTDEAIEIWRYLAGHRKNFPKYHDGGVLVVGIDESAWSTPADYYLEYCPPTMICIVRTPV